VTKATDTDVVHSITTAPEALEADQARRMRRYLYQMGFRAVCFVGAVLTSGWLRWSMVVVAVVIPYLAVIVVNAGRDKVEYDVPSVTPEPPKELAPATVGNPGTPGSGKALPAATIVDPES
jgi:hypothetical protein